MGHHQANVCGNRLNLAYTWRLCHDIFYWGWQDPGNNKACVSYFVSCHVPQEYISWSQCTQFLLILTTLIATYGNVLRVANMHSTKIHTSISSPCHTQEGTGHRVEAQISQDTPTESRKAFQFIAAAVRSYILTWVMYFCVRIAATVQPQFI